MKLNGTILRNARDAKTETQDDVALATGLTRTTVHFAEQGKSISAKTARRLCEHLGLDVAAAMIPRQENEDDDDAARTA